MMMDVPTPAAAWRRAAAARSAGFSLMEILIAMAISAILIGLAIPSYSSYMRKSRRVEARNALLDLASRQEKFFTTNNVYTGNPANLGLSGTSFPVSVRTSGTSYYTLGLALTNDNLGYTATATPTGTQTSDDCGNYTLTHLGVQGNTANALATSRCW